MTRGIIEAALDKVMANHAGYGQAVLLSQGNTIGVVSKKIGVSDFTYYRWRKEYGGMRVDQARRLKELEQENARLKKVVADFALDNAILKEAARGNF